MGNFINPIDLFIAFCITVIGLLGIKNGFIVELKKIINLLFSLLLTHLTIKYVIKLYVQSDIIIFVLYTLIFVFLILLIGFFIDIAIENLPSLTIDINVNRFIGLLIGIVKSLILIATILFFINLLPIQEDIKNKFFIKASEGSALFKMCNSLQSFIIN